MFNTKLKLGICGSSFKDGELRLPIHPEHLASLDENLKENLFIEEGYGQHFGVDSSFLKQNIKNIVPRQTLFEQSDAIFLLKPTPKDFQFFQEKQILCGWLYCVDNQELTTIAIDKKMTCIALEAMHVWQDENQPAKHIFYKNNEMGGYCSVLHSLEVTGIKNYEEKFPSVALIGFGNVARGAVRAFQELGYTDITIFTRQDYQNLQNPIPTVNYYQYSCVGSPKPNHVIAMSKNKDIPLAEELANYDIIVNCITIDDFAIVDLISNQQLKYFKPGTLIIDVTAASELALEFAKPTSFSQPTFEVGQGITYYAVDNSPTYLWKEATYKISEAILPYLNIVMAGEQAWKENLTIWKAIDIHNGIIQNPIISLYRT
ncbi:alanine dehydrogenase [Calothrix sp. NIES-4071]|nr:alanine dehydrogenase [Calothrix sp. NIES-4071]BAZ55722.1 alanine dehydrogenase [Calothrix sp. NIES-4105]